MTTENGRTASEGASAREEETSAREKSGFIISKLHSRLMIWSSHDYDSIGIFGRSSVLFRRSSDTPLSSDNNCACHIAAASTIMPSYVTPSVFTPPPAPSQPLLLATHHHDAKPTAQDNSSPPTPAHAQPPPASVLAPSQTNSEEQQQILSGVVDREDVSHDVVASPAPETPEQHVARIVTLLKQRRTFDQNHMTVLRELLMWNRELEPLDRKAKFCIMQKSPFRFYRGANHVFFHDFSRLKEFSPLMRKRAHEVWISGDLHTENLGSFENGKNEVVYDVNDFDESTVGDYQFDVWRMVTAIVGWFDVFYIRTSSEVFMFNIVRRCKRREAEGDGFL